MNISESKILTLKESCGVTYLSFNAFENLPFIKHAFSTKLGGVSENQFESMNLSFGRGDSDENVKENYLRMAKALDVDPYSMVASAQDHHTNIRTVTEKESGIGIWKPRDLNSVDGLITNTLGITLVTYYADCVPLYFIDPVKKVIGLAHAGWRGTVGRIGAKMVQRFVDEFSSNKCDIIVGIAPSIGPCCYEVDTPVYEQFAMLEEIDPKKCFDIKGGGKYLLNLWEINRSIIEASGVAKKNIYVTDICTRCNNDLLFSHRATNGNRGGLAAFLSII